MSTWLINGYRIRQAQRMLPDPAYDAQKIASIAFETSFNSLQF